MKFWGGWRRQKAHDLKEVLFGHCVAHSGAFGSSSSSSIIELSASSFSICMGGGRQYGRDQRTKEKRRERLCVRERRSILGKGAGNEWLLLACICKYTDTLPRAHTARDSSSQCVTLRQQPPQRLLYFLYAPCGSIFSRLLFNLTKDLARMCLCLPCHAAVSCVVVGTQTYLHTDTDIYRHKPSNFGLGTPDTSNNNHTNTSHIPGE